MANTNPAPWSYVKEYHCEDCAAADENYRLQILDANGRRVRGGLHDEALAGRIVNAINATLSAGVRADG